MKQLQLDPRKHGIGPTELAVRPEEIDEFNQFLEGMFNDYRPAGEAQRLMFGQILHASWNMRIARQLEAQALICCTSVEFKDLQSILRFLRQNERTFVRATKDLRNLQIEVARRETLAVPLDTSILVSTRRITRQPLTINNVTGKEQVAGYVMSTATVT